VYCECGWNTPGCENKTLDFPDVQTIEHELEARLKELKLAGQSVDSITFSGNGEPTTHPDFALIIEKVIGLRDKYTAKSKITVLTNATRIMISEVATALSRIDNPVLKLDSAIETTFNAMNQPVHSISLENIIDGIASFNGRKIIQTMFLRGEYKGKQIDNTSDPEINAYIRALDRIKPDLVMIYPIDRGTPAANLIKLSEQEMNTIASRLKVVGVPVNVVY